MKDDPIGPVRFTTLLVGALFFGVALAQSPGYPARTIRLVAGTAPAASRLSRAHVRRRPDRPARSAGRGREQGGRDRQSRDRARGESAPDGYTLLLVAGGNVVITPFLYGSLPFDPLNDIVPVFNVAGARSCWSCPACSR